VKNMIVQTQENIDDVKEWLELKLTTGKVSNLLVNQLAYGLVNRTIHVHIIYNEIGVLEGAPYSRSSNTKPATAFRRDPLIGLYHKHYSDPSHIRKNLEIHLKRHFNQYVARIENDIIGNQASVELTPARLNYINWLCTINAFNERNDNGEMTGEWIVYAMENGVKYYLTLAKHGDDDVTAASVRECAPEFPNLNLGRYI
jgi:hypothetical protein